MEDFYINSTSQKESYNYGYTIKENYPTDVSIMYVVTCIIIGIGLPLTLVAIFSLCAQVRNDQVAPIYIINLLISDLIQLCCMIVEVVDPEDWIIYLIYIYSLFASVYIMVCVALERYLVIAHPLWYRFIGTIKTSVVVCVVVWILPLVFFLTYLLWAYLWSPQINSIIVLLLPLALFIFFLGGTLKALSASHLPSDEKRRIVGILVLVLLIYTLLFLPTIILILEGHDYNKSLLNLSLMFLKLSPLADLVLYVFMRKGTTDNLLASVSQNGQQ